MVRNKLRIFAILATVLLNIGCDQATKQIARTNLAENEMVEVLSDVLVLTKVENTGAMLSLGANMPAYLRTILLSFFPALMLLFGLFYTIFKSRQNKAFVLGVCFMLGGGIGNIIDRLLYGSVTDFMILGVGDLHTGVFNMADVSIMIGVAVIIINSARRKDSPVSHVG